jgi:hypothetical protein
MRVERIGLVGAIAGVVLGGIIAAAGCEGGDDAVSGSNEAELYGGARFHHGHRGNDAGSVAGSTGTPAGGMGVVTGGTTGGGSAGSVGTNGNGAADGGAVADCDVCTKTQQCCDVVTSRGPACTFSAATCASMVGDARPAYVNACLVFLMAVRGAQINPPAECR